MPVPAPEIQWPAELREGGPARDTTIMLCGQARISGVPFRIIALRMRDGLRMPDYRADVPPDDYDTALDGMIGDIEDLVDSIEPELVNFNDGYYLLWMMPSAHQ